MDKRTAGLIYKDMQSGPTEPEFGMQPLAVQRKVPFSKLAEAIKKRLA